MGKIVQYANKLQTFSKHSGRNIFRYRSNHPFNYSNKMFLKTSRFQTLKLSKTTWKLNTPNNNQKWAGCPTWLRQAAAVAVPALPVTPSTFQVLQQQLWCSYAIQTLAKYFFKLLFSHFFPDKRNKSWNLCPTNLQSSRHNSIRVYRMWNSAVFVYLVCMLY